MSDYVAELRALIGHRQLLLPSVALIITDDAGRLLLVRSRDLDQWITVGGMVEPGERPELAAVREAREEIGVEVELGPLLSVHGGQGFTVRYGNGDEVAYVIIAYAATVVSDPRPDMDEVVELGWFSRSELPALPLSTLNRSLLTDLGFL